MAVLSEEAKIARREYQRAWREKNRDHLRAYYKEWAKTNRDKLEKNRIAYWERRAAESKEKELEA